MWSGWYKFWHIHLQEKKKIHRSLCILYSWVPASPKDTGKLPKHVAYASYSSWPGPAAVPALFKSHGKSIPNNIPSEQSNHFIVKEKARGHGIHWYDHICHHLHAQILDISHQRLVHSVQKDPKVEKLECYHARYSKCSEIEANLWT